MRIVCQQCSAAFAIDDKFITPKGVRAQCPRCKHLQLVKKDGAPASAMPPPASEPSAFDLLTSLPPPGAPIPPPLPPVKPAPAEPAPMPAFDFELEAAPAPKPNRSAPPPAPVPPPPVPSHPAPAPSSPFGPPGGELDFSDLGVDDPPPAAAAPVWGSMPPSQPQSPGPQAACKVCGNPLLDGFDQALGICDSCRAATESPTSVHQTIVPDAPSPFAAPPGLPPQADPFGDSDPFASTDFGEPPPPAMQTSAVRRAASAPQPVPEPMPMPEPEPSPALPSVAPTVAMRRPDALRMQDDDDDQGRSGNGKLYAAVAAGFVLMIGAGLLAYFRPWVRQAPPLVAMTSVTGGVSAPFEKVLAGWRVKWADKIQGSAEDHLITGEQRLEADTPRAYEEAEREFEQALVLDKSSDRAVAGWVLAVVFGRGERLDPASREAAEALLAGSEQRSGAPRVFTAHAHLLLATKGNSNDVQVMAERGKTANNDRDKALAALALGVAQLERNPQYAKQHLDEVVKLDPKLKRAALVRAQLAFILGQHRHGVTLLEQRLAADPDQWQAAQPLARLLVEAGAHVEARKLLERSQAADPKALAPRLSLALLAYQNAGDLAGGQAQIEALSADESLSAMELGEVLGHRATTERWSGALEGARATCDAVLEKKLTIANVFLQRILVALELGKPDEARAHWPMLKGSFKDAALEATLEARLQFAEGKLAEAYASALAAAEQDPRRVDGLLLAAAAAARQKNASKAFELALKRGLSADPVSKLPMAVLSPLPLRPLELLRPARGAFLPLSQAPDDPNPHLAEGLVAWFAGLHGEADQIFAKVLTMDPASGPALTYRALAALERKDVGAAVKFGAKAVEADRRSGVAHAVNGMALMAAKQVENGKRELRTATELAPGLHSAKVALAEVEQLQKKTDEARKLLVAVLLADPDHGDAKRVLLTLP